ncbi:hypothetical protein ACJQWK_05832 [Exserohilum turcicum]
MLLMRLQDQHLKHRRVHPWPDNQEDDATAAVALKPTTSRRSMPTVWEISSDTRQAAPALLSCSAPSPNTSTSTSTKHGWLADGTTAHPYPYPYPYHPCVMYIHRYIHGGKMSTGMGTGKKKSMQDAAINMLLL